MADDAKPPGKGGVIFRPYKTNPTTGEVMWAKDYGLRAWPIPVDDGSGPDKPKDV
jgi:hypothetical protein